MDKVLRRYEGALRVVFNECASAAHRARDQPLAPTCPPTKADAFGAAQTRRRPSRARKT
jgi:hypothetical protein